MASHCWPIYIKSLLCNLELVYFVSIFDKSVATHKSVIILGVTKSPLTFKSTILQEESTFIPGFKIFESDSSCQTSHHLGGKFPFPQTVNL